MADDQLPEDPQQPETPPPGPVTDAGGTPDAAEPPATPGVQYSMPGFADLEEGDRGATGSMDRFYEVSVPLDDDAGELRIGGSGRGKIHVGRKTIGQRVWRYVCQTVRFEM